MKTKNKGGRPLKEITENHLRQIEELAGYGLTQNAIAHVIGISHDTLTRRKEDQEGVLRALERGRAKAEAVIGESLFNRARDGDVPAIKWWEITRTGRVDASQIRHADAKGDTLPAPQTIIYIPANGRTPAPVVDGRVGANGHRPR